MPLLTPDERIGTTVGGKYRLDRILGTGGMGVVYAGAHLRLGRPVAVKFLHPQYATDAKIVGRFFVEAQAAARLKHRNVVEVYDVDHSEDGAAFMVLELLSGESLGSLLQRFRKLSVTEALAIVTPVLDALAQAHEAGIIHRDLKPDNIHLALDASGAVVPKVLDFGIAKLVDAVDATTTATGMVVGTPGYMAPERVMASKDAGAASDVWSMGVLLYECLTGRPPFDFPPDAVPTAVMMTIMTTAPRSLARDLPGAPAALTACVDRALAKDPNARWKNARELGAALARVPWPDERKPDAVLSALVNRVETASATSTPTVITAEPAPPATHRSFAVWPALLAIALVSAGALAWWIATDDGPTEIATPMPVAPELASPTVPEVAVPEVTAPEVAAPEVAAPEVAAPEVAAPEETSPAPAEDPSPRPRSHARAREDRHTSTGRAGSVSLDDF